MNMNLEYNLEQMKICRLWLVYFVATRIKEILPLLEFLQRNNKLFIEVITRKQGLYRFKVTAKIGLWDSSNQIFLMDLGFILMDRKLILRCRKIRFFPN